MYCYGCREYHAEGDHLEIRAKRAKVRREPLPCNVVPLGDLLFVNYQPPPPKTRRNALDSVEPGVLGRAAIAAAVGFQGVQAAERWMKSLVLVLALALGIGGVACGGDLDAMPDASFVDAEVVSIDAEVVSIDAEVDAFEMVCPLDEEFQTLECDGCNLFFGGTCYACTLYNGAAPIITVAGHCCNFDCCKGWDFPDGGVCP